MDVDKPAKAQVQVLKKFNTKYLAEDSPKPETELEPELKFDSSDKFSESISFPKTKVNFFQPKPTLQQTPLITIDQPSQAQSPAPLPGRRGQPRKSSNVIRNYPSPPILAQTDSDLISSRRRSKCHSDTFLAQGGSEGVIGNADNVPPVV